MSHESDTPDWHNGATYDYNVEAIPGADVENIGEAMFRWLLKQDESKDDEGILLYIYPPFSSMLMILSIGRGIFQPLNQV